MKLTKDNLPSDVLRHLFLRVEGLAASQTKINDRVKTLQEQVEVVVRGNQTIYETVQHITTGMGLEDTTENVMDISDKVARSMLLTFATVPLLMYLSFI